MILLHCTFWQNVSNVVGAGPREGVGCAAADSAKSLARFAVRHLDAIFGIVSAKALRPNDVTRACDPIVAANGGRIGFDRQVPWRRD